MSAPFFSNNDSEIGRLEELVVQEKTPPAAISGVFLGAVAVAGKTIRGPVGKAVLIGSPQRFADVYGGRDQGSGGAITNDVYKFMMNKPFGSLYVVRVAAAAAVKATKQLLATATPIVRVDAANEGVWGNNVTVDVQAASDGDSTHFNLVVSYLGGSKTYKNLNTSGSNDNTAQVIGSDDANWISVTKLANGRPDNVVAVPLLTGSDGTVADSDYTATNKGLEVAASAPGCGVVVSAEYMSAAIKTKMATLAAASSDRIFLVSADSETISSASSITEAGTLSRNDRLVYAFNHGYSLDNATATEVVTSPCSWLASVLSQVDVDEDPGMEETKAFTAGITRLYTTNLTRSDYIALRQAGICAMEYDNGFAFVSAVTTSLTPGKERISRRRSADYLILAMAKSLKYFVKKKNTPTVRAQMSSECTTFLADLQKAERIVATDSKASKGFKVDGAILNTQAQRDNGIEKLLVRVKLIGHILTLVLATEIGEGVTIVEQ